ncbi:MAG: phosphoadenylyl-sulfate reductase [Chlorobi bacterium]|nr:phosphoadenylyl-sulfate reductase [Chlorobiota bacterium]
MEQGEEQGYRNIVEKLNSRFKKYGPEEIIRYFLAEFEGKVAISSSMGIEDQVLTDMAVKINPEVKIFTLDTGRLFPETYDLIRKTNGYYGVKIQVYFPESGDVEAMVNEKGINLFYESIEYRKQCCHVRKLKPLSRALKPLDAWICGLRTEQSVTRILTRHVEWDEKNGLIKVNPLSEWLGKDIWDYVHKHNVPYNPLHDQGFPSIGCQPCTRAVKPGEDLRAGRWWWEQPEQKECGLHRK